MTTTPVVLVHAGAGRLRDDFDNREQDAREALTRALEAAANILERREGAVEAARAAVEVMEAYPLFNAGVGSVLCSDGSVEMSAGIMRGRDRAAGAVAHVKRSLHPIAAAHALLDHREVLLVGERADAHAAAHGVEQCDASVLITADQIRRLHERAAGDRGTVGAVCLDADGYLAAATSTGGRLGQRPGRVGDTPVIGAGTWADQHAAVSCTGEGEAFIRVGAARLLSMMVERGTALDEAAQWVLSEVGVCGGTGGLIALDREGHATAPFRTEAMPRGSWRAGGPVTVEIL